jgi:hypothetical protein
MPLRSAHARAKAARSLKSNSARLPPHCAGESRKICLGGHGVGPAGESFRQWFARFATSGLVAPGNCVRVAEMQGASIEPTAAKLLRDNSIAKEVPFAWSVFWTVKAACARHAAPERARPRDLSHAV